MVQFWAKTPTPVHAAMPGQSGESKSNPLRYRTESVNACILKSSIISCKTT